MDTLPRHARPSGPWPPIGSYFVVRTHGFVPWVIRRATHSWADHAGVVTDPDGGIVEAEPGGARRGHLSEYAGCRIAVNLGEVMTDVQRDRVAVAALGMVGVAYNDLDIADLGLEALGAHWRRLARWASDDGELICSQLVAKAGQAADVDWLCGRDNPVQVTPADLARRPTMQPWTCPD